MKKRKLLAAFFLLLAACVLALCIAAIRRARLLPSETGISVPIFMYHAVGNDCWGEESLFVKPEELEKQLQYLSENGYETIFFEDLAHIEQYEKPVMLTFDDGYESNYTLAFPILREYGAKAAISLITSRIDERADGFLTWDECREMAKSGLVEFASHTNDCHIRPDAPGIERKSGEDEETYISRISADLQTSITRIELETGQNVTTFTYPLGKMELWAEPFLQQHFAVTLSGVYGTARYGDSLYHLPRYNITDLHPASEYLPAS